MKKTFVSYAVCIMFLLAVPGLLLTGATQKFATKTLAMAQMRPLASQFAEVRKSTKGLALVNASQFSGEMVAMVINSGSEARIEFFSNGLMNTGTTPWTNVKVEATFEVTAISPNTTILAGARGVEMGAESHGTLSGVKAPQTITLSSDEFSMAPNKEYRGLVVFDFSAPNDDGRWVRVKVKSIKFKM